MCVFLNNTNTNNIPVNYQGYPGMQVHSEMLKQQHKLLQAELIDKLYPSSPSPPFNSGSIGETWCVWIEI